MEDILSVKKSHGGEINLVELSEEGTLKAKDQKKLDTFIEQVQSSIHQWKDKVKKSTDIEFEKKHNPVRVLEREK
jgi:hypothetical protein